MTRDAILDEWRRRSTAQATPRQKYRQGPWMATSPLGWHHPLKSWRHKRQWRHWPNDYDRIMRQILTSSFLVGTGVLEEDGSDGWPAPAAAKTMLLSFSFWFSSVTTCQFSNKGGVGLTPLYPQYSMPIWCGNMRVCGLLKAIVHTTTTYILMSIFRHDCVGLY